MKHLSIKQRITLWYTVLMLIIVVSGLGFMLAISDAIVHRNAKSLLASIVAFNAEEVGYEDGIIEEGDDFDFYKDGASSLVYTTDSVLIAGQLPRGFQQEVAFSDGVTQLLAVEGGQFLVHDEKVDFGQHQEAWVRGILPLDEMTRMSHSILRIALLTLPLLVVLAAMCGYWISERAFRPAREFNDTVASVAEGRDLSRRVEVTGGHDEVSTLAVTINGMLQRLEQSFEAEKQFVSDVSHELRTPVSVILAQCEFAMSQQPPPGEEQQEALEVIQRQAGRMHRLIARLLTITRLEQGTFQAALEETDLSERTLSLCEEQALLAPDHIELRWDVPAGIHARIDWSLYTRLFDNLVQNAFKYGKSCVEVSLREKDGKVLLRISDDGIGIAPEEQAKVWRRFYQASLSRTVDENESMGLGLAIVRQIALLHHGEVRLESTLGEGSAFTFIFPA